MPKQIIIKPSQSGKMFETCMEIANQARKILERGEACVILPKSELDKIDKRNKELEGALKKNKTFKHKSQWDG